VSTAELVPLLAEGGILGAVIWAMIVLHRSAITAHKQRADEWQAAYQAERALSAEQARQLAHVLGGMRDPAEAA
jgi:hypothetical protein